MTGDPAGPGGAQPGHDPGHGAAPDCASPSRRRFLKAGFGGAVLLGAGTGYAGWVEPERIAARTVVVRTPALRRDAPPLRIGHLSDLHCDSDRAAARVDTAVSLLLAMRPDVVALTGDYVTHHAGTWMGPCLRPLAPLAAVRGGVFVVLGNHDWWSGRAKAMARALGDLGFIVLLNSASPVPGRRDVWMVGVGDMLVHKQDAGRALRGVPSGAAKVLLIHEPDFADESPPGFCLQVSGHSHGGQVCLPGVGPVHLPAGGRHYPLGLRSGPNHPVYTTAGVGMVIPQVRLFCPPEATLLELRASEKPGEPVPGPSA